MIRVVLDTNVIISGLFWKGNPHRILRACTNKLRLVTSPDLLQELEEVLKREKKFGLSSREINKIVKTIAGIAEVVIPKEKLQVIKTDQSDNIILECALEGKADYVISGDKHLTSIGSYEGIKILKPVNAVKLLSL